MPDGCEDWEKLHSLLDERMDLNELNLLCNIYLKIDYENVSGGTKSLKLSELIKFMGRRNKINLLCYKIIKMRPDLEEEIGAMGCITTGTQSYIDIATDDFLPRSDIDHILRDPRKIYLGINCASVSQGDQTGEDAIDYIDTLLQEKSAILIVGDYGTGKSFLTQKIFLKNTSIATNGQTDSRIPILLPLKQFMGLASQDPNLALTKIVEHLRMLRFFSKHSRANVDEKIEVEARLRAGEFLCILDGFDEIPLITMISNPQDELAGLVDSLAIGHNRIVITSRPGILPGVLSPGFADYLPNLGVGYLLPWQGDETWLEYLRSCERLGIDFGAQGYHDFGQRVISKPELRQLTRTPLFCQMLVETRDDILQIGDFNLAKLYETYVGRYFENVRERSPIRLRFKNDIQKEITYKKSCLMATAVGMANSNSLRLTVEEIDQALKYEAQEYDDNLLAEFTRLDVLIYSLLVGDIDRKFSFSHKSFYDFFVALKIHKELLLEEDRFALLSNLPLTRESISFLVGLLSFYPGLRVELQQAFDQPLPLQFFNIRGENRILLRNLALTQLDLVQRLEKVNLNDLNFSGYTISSAKSPRELVKVNLDGCNLEGALLIKANLRNSSLRTAKLNRCILDQADLRGVDLFGTELQDISCQNTRFSGANFAGAILRAKDMERIRLALYAEQVAFPDTVADAWIMKTLKILKKSLI